MVTLKNFSLRCSLKTLKVLEKRNLAAFVFFPFPPGKTRFHFRGDQQQKAAVFCGA
jgi:hypothetical protein